MKNSKTTKKKWELKMKNKKRNEEERDWRKKIAKERKVIPDPIDD